MSAPLVRLNMFSFAFESWAERFPLVNTEMKAWIKNELIVLSNCNAHITWSFWAVGGAAAALPWQVLLPAARECWILMLLSVPSISGSTWNICWCQSGPCPGMSLGKMQDPAKLCQGLPCCRGTSNSLQIQPGRLCWRSITYKLVFQHWHISSQPFPALQVPLQAGGHPGRLTRLEFPRLTSSSKVAQESPRLLSPKSFIDFTVHWRTIHNEHRLSKNATEISLSEHFGSGCSSAKSEDEQTHTAQLFFIKAHFKWMSSLHIFSF